MGKRKMAFCIMSSVMFCVLHSNAQAQTATLYESGDQKGFVKSIEGVMIEGTKYNIELSYGVSFNSVWGKGVQPRPKPVMYDQPYDSAVWNSLFAQIARVTGDSQRANPLTMIIIPMRHETEGKVYGRVAEIAGKEGNTMDGNVYSREQKLDSPNQIVSTRAWAFIYKPKNL